MIGKLTGILSDKNPPEVIVDCHGVGYEVNVPMSTFFNLPATGEKVSLLTHFVVREDAQILYGFGSAAEREAFRQLIKISGVGPRTALSVLSGMSVSELAQAITSQEAGRLVKVPGIGKKTAERLLLELKASWAPTSVPPLPPWATRKVTSSRRWWRWATATRKRLPPSRACLPTWV